MIVIGSHRFAAKVGCNALVLSNNGGGEIEQDFLGEAQLCDATHSVAGLKLAFRLACCNDECRAGIFADEAIPAVFIRRIQVQGADL